MCLGLGVLDELRFVQDEPVPVGVSTDIKVAVLIQTKRRSWSITTASAPAMVVCQPPLLDLQILLLCPPPSGWGKADGFPRTQLGTTEVGATTRRWETRLGFPGVLRSFLPARLPYTDLACKEGDGLQSFCIKPISSASTPPR